MKVSVTFRNGEGENWQKDYAQEKIQKLKKYLDSPAEAHVIISLEKFRNTVEINVSSAGGSIHAKEEGKDLRTVFDKCLDKVEKQIKKQKEKIREHQPKSIRKGQETAAAEEDLPHHRITETRKVVLKPMSYDEAILEMEERKDHFIIFRDAATENISLIYRREDGNFGLIETK